MQTFLSLLAGSLLNHSDMLACLFALANLRQRSLRHLGGYLPSAGLLENENVAAVDGIGRGTGGGRQSTLSSVSMESDGGGGGGSAGKAPPDGVEEGLCKRKRLFH